MNWVHLNWYSFVWIGGDHLVDQHRHNIDVSNWVMGTHPIEVVSTGGAIWRPRDELYGNIYDHFSSDFVYANGVRMSSYFPQFPEPAPTNISEMVLGSKRRRNTKALGPNANTLP